MTDITDKLYTICVWDDVEPAVHGPYDNEEKRIEGAKEFMRDNMQSSVFRLDIDSKGVPSSSVFTNDEMEE